MALITLLDAQLAFGHVPLLDHADFSLLESERIGLIGRNGAGKSSMLKILGGLEKADDGTLQLQQNLRVAYVAQEPLLDSEATVFAAASEGLAHVIASREMYLNAVEGADLDALQSEIEAYDAWNWEQRVEETLASPAPRSRGTGRLALRRDAQARRIGASAGRGARCAAARRTNQPSGPRLDRMAGTVADRLQGKRGHHHPRPKLPEPRGDPQSSSWIGASSAPTLATSSNTWCRRKSSWRRKP